jgi:tetratricopeptide (TPR) repeat protein
MRWAELQKVTSRREFYRQSASEILKGVHTKKAQSDLGNDLISLAEHAYSLRYMDILEQISQVLLKLPLECEFRIIARYYQALCIKRRGRFHQARALLERVAEEAPIAYRARAMQSIGSIAFDSGDFKSAMLFYIEASKAAIHKQGFDPLATFYTQHMIAVLRSVDGDNRGSLADLQRMFPLVRAVGSSYPPIYYSYLNSLAVELAQLGRLEEAARTCQITLASPFASVYPEYRETHEDIALRGRRASRSIVSFARRTRKPNNILRLPARELRYDFGPAASYLSLPQQPARILNYSEWKDKMVKEPNRTSQYDKPHKKLDGREKILRIIKLVSQTERTDQELEEILEAVERIISRPMGTDKQ